MIGRAARASALALVTGFFAPVVLSCASAKPAIVKPAFDTTRPHWQDAFDRVPDIVVLVHPRALARDPVYGALLKSMTKMMAARSQSIGTRTAEVIETCDEVIFGLRERGDSDAVVILRGVRADFDARKITDASGRVMWTDGTHASVPELTRAGAEDASLFVLPDRTWVFALGNARARAREAFSHPFDRPPPLRDDASLLLVRLDGPSLVQGVPRLHDRNAPLAPLGRKLSWVSIALRPGKEGLATTLNYSEEDSAAFAETLLKQVVEALGEKGSDSTKWIGQTKVERQASTITARVSLPPKLVEDLPNVNPAELGF